MANQQEKGAQRHHGPHSQRRDGEPITEETTQRFWAKVRNNGPDECWTWTAYTDRDGYGRFSLNGRKERAHRIAVRLDGRNPDGKVVRHTCDNPECVNPAHLKLGSQRENIRDRDKRNRQPRGERNGRSRLSREDVKSIREDDRPAKELAKRFDTTSSNVREIRSGRSWRHVE